MRRLMLSLSYDGTNYNGFQKQPDGSAVQDRVDEALRELLGENIRTMGASRTDAGVHARHNILVFSTNSRIPGDRWPYAINTKLPEDIVVFRAEEVDEDFHPLRETFHKTYEYRILTGTFPCPFRRNFVWHVNQPLDIEAMRRAVEPLIGVHDFKAFTAENRDYHTTVREIFDVTVQEVGDEVRFRISGDGFLYHMVRIIVGTLKEIGIGKKPEDTFSRALKEKDRLSAGMTAPAQGLTLAEMVHVPGKKKCRTLSDGE